jgi:hypothetical protein
MQFTIEIPDELAARMGSERERIISLIEAALQEQRSDPSVLAQDIIEFFAKGPDSSHIVEFKPSARSVERARELLEKNREGTLTPAEQIELDQMSLLNRLFSMIKAKAKQHLQAAA